MEKLDLPRIVLPPEFNPLSHDALMVHQKNWIADTSPLKVCVKGRRTGITFAEALDCTVIAASSRSAGGDNVYYIGDSKDKGREFCQTVAEIARALAKGFFEVEEFLFEDKREDGESKHIAAFRVKFASGYSVVGLSSRPSNIRGLQGVVVIDEAAFHQNVSEVLKAVYALLIWGGRVRIISTHNGEENEFNQLLKDIQSGRQKGFSPHRYTFEDAVNNGLYERVCAMRGWTPSEVGKKEWIDLIHSAYGSDTDARDEELYCKPRSGSGVFLPRALVSRCAVEGIPIRRWKEDKEWYLDDSRLEAAASWFALNVLPVLPNFYNKPTVFGQDFGRDGNLSVIWVMAEQSAGQWETALVIELRQIPFDVQQYVLFELVRRLPKFRHGMLDARGNGQGHAEAAQQEFGIDAITCIKATPEWYAVNFPKYRAAFEDKSLTIPDDEDIINDHRLIVVENGRPRMSDRETKGSDGFARHGDAAIAGLLAWASTSMDGTVEFTFRASSEKSVSTQLSGFQFGSGAGITNFMG